MPNIATVLKTEITRVARKEGKRPVNSIFNLAADWGIIGGVKDSPRR